MLDFEAMSTRVAAKKTQRTLLYSTVVNFNEMCPKIQIILLIIFVKNDKINEKYLKYSSFMKKNLKFAKIEKNVSVNLDLKQ